MNPYRVAIEARAQKEIRKLPAPARQQVTAAIDGLAEEPRPAHSRKMVGSAGFRLRVGDYRVIYEIEHARITVYVVKVGHRKDIYR